MISELLSSRRTRRVSVVALAVLLAAALLIGCSPGGDTTSGDAAGAERRFLSLGSAPPGGAFFVIGGALAEVLDQMGPEGWQVSNEATKGSQENIRRLAAGELDVALSNSAITYFAVRGEGAWDQAYNVKSVMTLAPNVALFLAPASGEVQTLADLKGKRAVVGPAGAGFEYFLEPILAAHGVSYDDFTPLNNTQAGAVDMLADGSASAAFLGGAVPTASITQASTSMDVRFVPFDDEAKAQLLADYPFFQPASIPAETYRNQTEDFDGLNVGSMHLIVPGDAPDELVYEITKTLWENREAVVERHPAGRAINPKVAIRDTGTEFHPGAVRWFQEIGIWPGSEPQGAQEETEAEAAVTDDEPAAE